MKKVTSSLAVLALSAGLVTALGVAPAQAATCAAYPPGSSYTVDITPLTATVKKNGVVTVVATAHRGQTVCAGQTVGFQYAKPGQHFVTYRYGVTNGNGVAAQDFTVPVKNLTVRILWHPTPHTVITSAQAKYTYK